MWLVGKDWGGKEGGWLEKIGGGGGWLEKIGGGGGWLEKIGGGGGWRGVVKSGEWGCMVFKKEEEDEGEEEKRKGIGKLEDCDVVLMRSETTSPSNLSS